MISKLLPSFGGVALWLGSLSFCFALQAQQPGQFDPGFDARFLSNSGVISLAVQDDGKVIVLGSLNVPDSLSLHTLLRLEADGTIDRTFQRFDPNFPALLAIQPDKKILVTTESSITPPVVRLNPDGSIDSGFAVPITSLVTNVGSVRLNGIALQEDGKIILVGKEIHIGSSRGIVRLNKDGTVDSTFSIGSGFHFWSESPNDPNSIPPGGVYQVAIQSDGKILVAGDFIAYGDGPRNDIARLNPDGTLDTSFNPGAQLPELMHDDGFIHEIPSMALSPGGDFYVLVNAYPSENKIVKFNSSGALDKGFTQVVPTNGSISQISLLPDGNLLAMGGFTELAGLSRTNIARLHSDGTIDTEWNLNWPSAISVVKSAPDGRLYLGGAFKSSPDFPRNVLARVFAGPVDTAPPKITTQPSSLTVSAEAEALFQVVAQADPAPGYQWFFNGQALAGQTNNQLLLPYAQLEQAGRYRAVVSNSAGNVTSEEATLAVVAPPVHPGAVDITFRPDELTNISGLSVSSIAPSSDGGLFVARLIATPQGRTNEVVKFDGAGHLDANFRGALNDIGIDSVSRIFLQSDDKLVIIGASRRLPGAQPVYRLLRLNTNGTLDATFAPSFNPSPGFLSGYLQKDDRVLVVGRFTSVNGVARTNMVRLLKDGQVDASFDPSHIYKTFLPSSPDTFSGIQAFDNGEIIAMNLGFSVRLNSDGSRYNDSFNFGASGFAPISGDSLLVAFGGTLTTIEHAGDPGTVYQGLVRLLPNNAVDPRFYPKIDGGGNIVFLQPDMKILLGGSFQHVNGVAKQGIARLNPDGSLDSSFDAPGPFLAIVPALDGKLWVAGNFDHLDGFRRQGIARLHNNPLLKVTRPAAKDPMRITFPTAEGKQYHVEYSESLQATSWKPLQTISGDNTTREITDPASGGAQRFYRVWME